MICKLNIVVKLEMQIELRLKDGNAGMMKRKTTTDNRLCKMP